MGAADPPVALVPQPQSDSWPARWCAWRDRLLTSPEFQRRAARNWFLRPLVRRRARALFDLVSGFVYSQVLLGCVRVRAFEILAEGPQERGRAGAALRRAAGRHRAAARRRGGAATGRAARWRPVRPGPARRAAGRQRRADVDDRAPRRALRRPARPAGAAARRGRRAGAVALLGLRHRRRTGRAGARRGGCLFGVDVGVAAAGGTAGAGRLPAAGAPPAARRRWRPGPLPDRRRPARAGARFDAVRPARGGGVGHGGLCRARAVRSRHSLWRRLRARRAAAGCRHRVVGACHLRPPRRACAGHPARRPCGLAARRHAAAGRADGRRAWCAAHG